MSTPSDNERTMWVWDAPVRVFHWLMVACFAGAWITADSERWRLVHVTLGETMIGLAVWRVVWGVVGTRYARFSQFVRPPSAAWQYLKRLLSGTAPATVGHNPVGAWAIVGLLLATLLTASTGWLANAELAGEWLGELHEGLATAMLWLVGVHVAGVLIGSRLHHESLIRAMVTGRKAQVPGEGIARPWAFAGWLVLAAVLGFWIVHLGG
jgi:cytochrome b